ncbi:MAG: hypothetical protein U0531_01680 [Dehalococcoidia bacterium]
MTDPQAPTTLGAYDEPSARQEPPARIATSRSHRVCQTIRRSVVRALDIYAATRLDFGDAMIVATMETAWGQGPVPV